MELGTSTGIFYRQDLVQNLPLIRRAGFRRVELCVGERKDGRVLHYDWRDGVYTEKVRQVLKELDLSVSSLHAPYSPELDPSLPDPARRRATLDELCGVARVLKSFGGHTLVVHVAVNEFDLKNGDEKSRRLDNVRQVLHPLVEEIKSLGLRLALENLLPHLMGGDLETLQDLFSPFPADLMGLCFDTSHANLWAKPSVYELLEKSLPRLMATHLSDNRGAFDDHFTPGEGNIDWNRVMTILRRARYDGVVLLEVFRDPKNSSPADVLTAAYQRAQKLLS